jgi:uncharacterized protein YndB with AHSA1/START domain
VTIHTDDPTVVRSEVDVAVPPERAFAVFTDGMDTWWPRSHHVQSGTLTRIGMDPGVGGGLWEENDAGEVCVWGRVLSWDPPREFSFSWLIGTDWAPPTPEAHGSRVTVTFTAAAAGTHVACVHDRLDVHGTGWESIRDAVASDGGWPEGLRRFAAAV